MTTTLRQELLRNLIELSRYHPSMRFGQLVCMASSGAGGGTPGLPRNTDDQAVREAVGRSLATRRSSGVVGGGELAPPAPQVVAIARELERLAATHPEWSVSRLVFNLAALAHVNIYDIEDDELLAAARSEEPGLRWFRRYTDSLEGHSTVAPRRNQRDPAYSCPCCHQRTLYERGGFDICPVCYWEDDGQDDEDADAIRGGPNGTLSLTEARENYRRLGVCDPRFTEHTRPPLPQEKCFDGTAQD